VGIARQQWRARIETLSIRRCQKAPPASPASNGGRGLKPFSACQHQGEHRIARQQWRARIETALDLLIEIRAQRIARQQWRARIETTLSAAMGYAASVASPASNGGRGLKPCSLA